MRVGKSDRIYSVWCVLPSPPVLQHPLPLLSVPSLPFLSFSLGSSLQPPPGEVLGLVSEGRLFWWVPRSPSPSFPFSPSLSHLWSDQLTKEQNQSSCYFCADPQLRLL